MKKETEINNKKYELHSKKHYFAVIKVNVGTEQPPQIITAHPTTSREALHDLINGTPYYNTAKIKIYNIPCPFEMEAE